MDRDPYSRRRAVLGGVILSFLLTTSAGAADKKPEEFREAIQAQDKEDWSESIRLLQHALEKQPEDGSPVRIYGTRYLSYLPLYYMGLAWYKQNDCAKALEQWDRSLGIGAVQTTAEFQRLLEDSEKCKEKAIRK